MGQKFEFCLEESCINDMQKYALSRSLLHNEWCDVIYKARLETQNLGSLGRLYHSEKIAEFDTRQIWKLRKGQWRMLLLVKGDVSVVYGIGFWHSSEEKTHQEIMEEHAKVLETYLGIKYKV